MRFVLACANVKLSRYKGEIPTFSDLIFAKA